VDSSRAATKIQTNQISFIYLFDNSQQKTVKHVELIVTT